MSNIFNCPVCDSARTETFLKRKNVPVHQNLLCKDKDSAINTVRGDLDLTICLNCLFIFNKAFDLSKLSYGKDYDNTQTFSIYFSDYIDELINKITSSKEINNSTIVEIGCGKGLFIKKLMSNLASENIGYGFDPSYVGPLIEFNGRLKFEKRIYSSDCSNIKTDIVICRHVIEHIPNPLELVLTIKEAVKKSDQVHIFFETPYVDWIINNEGIFDFFYEHCSYFNPHSLTVLFEKAGFKVNSVEKVFGEQYLWLEATNNTNNSVISRDISPDNFLNSLKTFRDVENKFIRFWKSEIKKLSLDGKVAVWGAGAKGVTFANLIDPDNELISAFIDLNPNKQGLFILGTGHPIIDYKSVPDNNIEHIILMNSNYMTENQLLLDELESHISLIDLIEYSKTRY